MKVTKNDLNETDRNSFSNEMERIELVKLNISEILKLEIASGSNSIKSSCNVSRFADLISNLSPNPCFLKIFKFV